MPPDNKKLQQTKRGLSGSNHKHGSANEKIFEIGKLPPQAIDLEEAVLGAVMLDKNSITDIVDILSPESFYKEAHNILWEAILFLFRNGQPIDILTVTQRVKKEGKLDMVGGAYYISQLTNRVASSANTEFHARIIAQKYMQRRLIKAATDTIKDAYAEESDVFDILDGAQTSINDIVAENIKGQGEDATQIFTDVIGFLEKASLNKGEIIGIPTRLRELNKLTNGWQKGQFIVVAGRPGMGKSAFAQAIMRGALDAQYPVGFFSLEMPTRQVALRLIAEDTGVSLTSLKSGLFEQYTNFNAINQAITKYWDKNQNPLLFIDDSPYLSIIEFRAKAKRLKMKHNVQMIVIDYLQLMSGISGRFKSENRVNEMDAITRGLKAVAKELDIPIIALAQLNRATETSGGDMRPKLSNLRESGGIEQDADMVIFLYRPEYYAEMGKESFREVIHKGETISSEGYAEIIIAKHRDGPTGSIAARFDGRIMKFSDWDDASSGSNYQKTSTPTPQPTGPRIEPPEENTMSNPIQPNKSFFDERKSNNNIWDNDNEEPPF